MFLWYTPRSSTGITFDLTQVHYIFSNLQSKKRLFQERTQRQDLDSQVAVLREENARITGEKEIVQKELQR